MKAVVFADRIGAGLAPLTEREPVALLPVAGRPLVVHTLEALVEAGVRELWLVVSTLAERIEARLGDGTREGVQLAYLPARPGDAPGEVLRRIRSQLSGPTLVLRGDVLRTGSLEGFLAQAKLLGAPVVHGTVHDAPAGVVWLLDGAAATDALPGDPDVHGDWPTGEASLELEGAAFSLLGSLPEYHRACLDAAGGRFPGLRVPGRELQPLVRVGPHGSVPLGTVRRAPLFAGPRCQVHSEATLEGDVVLESDVVVDAGATLRECVVLPDTYVGEHVLLERSLAWGDLLFHVDHGVAVRVHDAFLLARLSPASLRRRAASLLQQGAGLGLLLLSAPLWPAALLLSLLSDPTQPLRASRAEGNRFERGRDGRKRRRIFRRRWFVTSVPALRRLPDLLAVVSGDLALVGVPPSAPAEPEAGGVSGLAQLAARAPRGLFGPVHTLDEGASADERLLVAAEFGAKHGLLADGRWLVRGVRALFRSGSWRPSKPVA